MSLDSSRFWTIDIYVFEIKVNLMRYLFKEWTSHPPLGVGLFCENESFGIDQLIHPQYGKCFLFCAINM